MESNLQGNIIKIFSDFYYVKVADEIFECKVREVIKKSKTTVWVGDKVELDEVNFDTKQAVIKDISPRINFITRPSIANIDRVIVVAALKEPEFDYIQLNRYLVFAKKNNIPAVICVNKDDLASDNSAKEHIEGIYNSLGYEVIFTSAKEKIGIERLESVLEEGISVLCGQSGVGKSSLLNAILPTLNLKTKQVSSRTERGTHTTRHTELIEVPLSNGKVAKVADTPGFSNLKFDDILPVEVGKLFSDITEFAQNCKYNDCLHIEEDGCDVLKNLDKMAPYRYESYRSFVEEAIENKEKNTSTSSKKESKMKISGGKKIIKLGAKAKEKSRKVSRQSLNITTLDDVHEDF